MRKRLLRTIMIVAFALIATFAQAIPAKRQAVTIKQPNGKLLTFVLYGDEKVSWAKTVDQYTLVRNGEGFFTYGVLNERGDLVASDVLAANPEERTGEDRAFLSLLPTNLYYSSSQVDAMKNNWAAGAPATNQAKYPTQGTVKLLVILVGFSDLPFTYTNADFVNLVSQQNYNGTGSVKDYYLDNSNGEFIMDIDVVGPYTLPNTMAYYGANGPYGDANIPFFVSHSINAADADVDFSDYDNDNNGFVDAIHIIFAGTPESSTGNDNEIWPHRSNVNSNIQKDGVRFGPYSCSAEKRNSIAMDGIGTICHEFGHVLGFPDFYDTDYDGSGGDSQGLGEWDLMSSGSYLNNSATPAGLSAIERQIANWLTPVELTSATDSIYLPALTDSAVAYTTDLPNTNEYFMIEHRMKKGWDTYIPSEGMLIYHGDKAKLNDWFNNHSNDINVNPNDMGWFIKTASGNNTQLSSSTCPFPGSLNVVNFTDETNPPSTMKDGTPSNRPITNIHYENDSVIRFNFMSNVPAVETDAVTNTSITSTTATVRGHIVYAGEGNITSRGAVWSDDMTAIESMVGDNLTEVASTVTTDTFDVALTDLIRGATIYYRAYVENASGKAYGAVKQFNTPSGLGSIVSRNPSNIGNNSVTMEATLVSFGEGTFVEKGFVFNTDSETMPDVDNATKLVSTDPEMGTFTLSVDTLREGVTYYYRAFVTTSLGTAYGVRKTFTTTYPAIENNVIGSNQAFCIGATPEMLTGSEPTGGRGNFTYQWQQKSRTGAWTDATQLATEQNYQPEELTDSTFYRRIVISNGVIKDTSNTVLIDVMISRGGVLTKNAADTVVREQGQDIALFRLNSYRGQILDWERQIDDLGWNPIGNTQSSYTDQAEQEALYTYRVKVQLEDCPEAYSNEEKIYVRISSSLEEIDCGIEFTFSPNPTSGILTIKAPEQKNAELTITNILGQVVYQERNADLENKTINLQTLENGSYLVNIRANGKQTTKQIIFNK